MENQSNRKLSARDRALDAIELETKIQQASVEGKRKEVRALLSEWEATMDDDKVKKAYRVETAGVDPEIARQELGTLAV